MSAALAIETNVVTQIVSHALQKAFGRDKSATKRVAAAANSNMRAAENWLAGRNAPDAVHLLRLMAVVPELQSEVRRITGMMADMDPELDRELHDLFRVWQRRRERT